MERSALVVPCYGDAARDLGAIIDEMVRAGGKTIDRGARERLAGLLGGDRQTSRREIEKLLLYAGSDSEIADSHIEAVIGDTAQRELGVLVDAVFAGRLPALDLAQSKLGREGLDAGVMLGGVLRHALGLLKARQSVDAGRSTKDAVAAMRLPFPRVAPAEAALAAWPTPKLVDVVSLLGATMLAVRRDAETGKSAAIRALWTMARQARSGSRGHDASPP